WFTRRSRSPTRPGLTRRAIAWSGMSALTPGRASSTSTCMCLAVASWPGLQDRPRSLQFDSGRYAGRQSGMPTLYGRRWTRAEWLGAVGDMAQVAGIRESRLVGGRAEGVRALDFNCGDGFRFTVLPDRCMDIPFAEYGGAPLAWVSRTGIAAPQYYEPD